MQSRASLGRHAVSDKRVSAPDTQFLPFMCVINLLVVLPYLLSLLYVDAVIIKEEITGYSLDANSICSYFHECKSVHTFDALEECLQLSNPDNCSFSLESTSQGSAESVCNDGVRAVFRDWAYMEDFALVEEFDVTITLREPIGVDTCHIIYYASQGLSSCTDTPVQEASYQIDLPRGAETAALHLVGGQKPSIFNDAFLLTLEVYPADCHLEIAAADYSAKGVKRDLHPTGTHTKSHAYIDFNLTAESAIKDECNFPASSPCINVLEDDVDSLLDCLRLLPSTCTYARRYSWDGTLEERCGDTSNAIDIVHLLSPFQSLSGTWIASPDLVQIVSGYLQIGLIAATRYWDDAILSAAVTFVRNPTPSSCDEQGDRLGNFERAPFDDGVVYKIIGPSPVTSRMNIEGKVQTKHVYLKDAIFEYILHGGVPDIAFDLWEVPVESFCAIEQCRDIATIDHCVAITLSSCTFRATHTIQGGSARVEDICAVQSIVRLPESPIRQGVTELYSGIVRIRLSDDGSSEREGLDIEVYALDSYKCDTEVDISSSQLLERTTITNGEISLDVTSLTSGILYLKPVNESIGSISLASLIFDEPFKVVRRLSGSITPQSSVSVVLKGLIAIPNASEECLAIPECHKPEEENISDDDVFQCTRRASYNCQYNSRRRVTGSTTEVCYGTMQVPLASDLLYRSVTSGNYSVAFNLAIPITDDVCKIQVYMLDSCEAGVSSGDFLVEIDGKRDEQVIVIRVLPATQRRRVLSLYLPQQQDLSHCGLAVVSVDYDVEEMVTIDGATEIYEPPESAADPSPPNQNVKLPESAILSYSQSFGLSLIFGGYLATA